VPAEEMEMHGQPWSADFTLPPLSVIVFVATNSSAATPGNAG